MMNRTMCFILILNVSLCGCGMGKDYLRKQREQQEPQPAPLVQMVESTDLAKVIIKPKQEKLVVEKDPFMPLFNKGKGMQNVDGTFAQNFRKVRYLGLIRMDDQFSALLITDEKKGVYQVHDKIKGFIIRDIKPDEVVLTTESGDKTFSLKRSESK